MEYSDSQRLPSSRFSVVCRLGEGGMGSVYEAMDQERKARVALKVLRRLGAEEVLRFKGEFRRLQDLHHPNLVSLGELVEEHGQWFFTMELVRGCDFLTYVRAQPTEPGGQGADTEVEPSRPVDTDAEDTYSMEPVRAVGAPQASPRPVALGPRAGHCFDEQRLREALAQLVLGLRALHRVGKVHRDIKPSNILVTSEGRVVLLDFGILSDVEEGEQGVVVGTAAYMAPEQARGAAPSPEADWYSVGVLLYQALTGYKPFTGSPREVLALKCRVEPVLPAQRVAGLPEDLGRLCEELLRMDPRQRPSGEQVLRRLGVEQEASEEVWSTLALPFMGRHAELAALHQALEESRRGGSVAVRVEGESGVGKSRLVRRFVEEVTARWPGAVVLAGRCYERESVPYKGVDGLVDALARHLSGQGRDKAWSVLGQESHPLVRLFPVLGKVEPLALSHLHPVPADPMQVRLAAFVALREVLRRLAEQHPVVLVVDDLQWADGDSAALLDEVLQAPGLLLVATVRVTTLTETGRGVEVASSRFWEQARVVELRGLPPEEAQCLVERLLQERGGAVGEQARRIAQESGGHPLFIDALVRHRSGVQGGDEPCRLEQVLWARACLLEPAARRLLELLAVAGGPLTQEVAAHASSLEPVEYARAAASLRGARLAFTTGPAATDTLEVLHDKVRQAVGPYLEPLARRGWHTRLASSLETLGQGSAETLARHWLEAGQPARAADYYVQAAREASAVLAFSRAASLYQRALGLREWERERRRQLQVARGEALAQAGRGSEAAQAFLAAAEGASAEEARTLERRAGEQLMLCGHVEEALVLLRRVVEAVGARCPETEGRAVLPLLWHALRLRLGSWQPRPRPPEECPPATRERLEVLGSMSQCLGWAAPLRSWYFHARHMRLALRCGEPRNLCRTLAMEATGYALRGRSHLSYVERCARLAEEIASQLEGDEASLGFVLASRAGQHAFLGDMRAARSALERALELLERCQQAWWERSVAWETGSYCLLVQGDVVHLGARLELALREARERGDRRTCFVLATSGGVLVRLSLRDLEGAEHLLEEAQTRWMHPDNPFQKVSCLLLGNNLMVHRGQVQAARRRLDGQWSWLRRSGIFDMPFIHMLVLEHRARLYVQEAALGVEQAPELLRAVEADARRMERLGLPLSAALACSLHAAVADLRGRPEAIELYERAEQALEAAGAPLYAMGQRIRRGRLLGGEQGRLLVASGRGWMEQQGARNLDMAEVVLTSGVPPPGSAA